VNTCDALDRFFDGELSAKASAEYRDHLAGCARCQAVLQGRMLEAVTVQARQGRRAFLALRSSPRARAVLVTAAAVAVAAVLALVLWPRGHDAGPMQIAAGPVDAALPSITPLDASPPVDADDRDQIVALSRFGYFSITASARTTIFIDGNRVGETPLTQFPLTPGPHKVKAIGPRGKVKQLTITIYGGRTTDEGTITW